MRHSLEYALRRGEIFSKSIHFDFHDNFKDIGVLEGLAGSSQTAAQAGGSGAAQSGASGPLTASDNAMVFGSNNSSIENNVLDPGAIEAGRSIAESGLEVARYGIQQAGATLERALSANQDIAGKATQGEVTTLAKSLGWIAGGLLALYLGYKAFTGRKKS